MSWRLVRCTRLNEPTPFFLTVMKDDGEMKAYGHERFTSSREAITRARYLAMNGFRVDVHRTIAASERNGA